MFKDDNTALLGAFACFLALLLVSALVIPSKFNWMTHARSSPKVYAPLLWGPHIDLPRKPARW